MTTRIRRGASALFVVCVLGISASPYVGAQGVSAPYKDANAEGYIGLCDQSGHQVTHGSVDATPLAWRAVSSTPAKAPYNNDWRTALLLAYQPTPFTNPGQWSGEGLTSSSRYSNPEHPMVAATDGDLSLRSFLEAYHANWQGFVQLRIYLGTRGAPVYAQHYPSLDLQVTGNTWHAVGGGPVDCHSGTSESLESIVLPPEPTTSTLPGQTTTTTTTTLPPVTTTSIVPASGPPTSHSGLILVFVLVVVLGGATLAFALRGRDGTSTNEVASNGDPPNSEEPSA